MRGCCRVSSEIGSLAKASIATTIISLVVIARPQSCSSALQEAVVAGSIVALVQLGIFFARRAVGDQGPALASPTQLQTGSLWAPSCSLARQPLCSPSSDVGHAPDSGATSCGSLGSTRNGILPAGIGDLRHVLEVLISSTSYVPVSPAD